MKNNEIQRAGDKPTYHCQLCQTLIEIENKARRLNEVCSKCGHMYRAHGVKRLGGSCRVMTGNIDCTCSKFKHTRT